MVIKEVTLADGSKKTKSSCPRKPRVWRWLNTKPLASKCLLNVLDAEKNFYFGRFSYTLGEMFKPILFEAANVEIELWPREEGRYAY